MGNMDNESFQDTVKTYNLSVIEQNQDINDVSLGEKKYIYSVCSILAHKYVWMFNEIEESVEIPYSISKPWYDSSEVLGLKCVLTHASVDLYNWRLKNPTLSFSLDNIESINLMKGNLPNYSLDDIKDSESWFYLIMVAIEGICGPMIENMEEIYTLLGEDESLKKKDDILINLIQIRDYLRTQSNIITQIYKKCVPDILYNQTRKYLWGSSKTSNGWNLQGIDAPPIKLEGGSASQSSLISLEDIFFSIKHNINTGEFLMRMRDYMPSKHRDYLEYCETRPKLRDYISDYIELE
jgi:indoleamine 2,3-dioxygenase